MPPQEKKGAGGERCHQAANRFNERDNYQIQSAQPTHLLAGDLVKGQGKIAGLDRVHEPRIRPGNAALAASGCVGDPQRVSRPHVVMHAFLAGTTAPTAQTAASSTTPTARATSLPPPWPTLTPTAAASPAPVPWPGRGRRRAFVAHCNRTPALARRWPSVALAAFPSSTAPSALRFRARHRQVRLRPRCRVR